MGKAILPVGPVIPETLRQPSLEDQETVLLDRSADLAAGRQHQALLVLGEHQAGASGQVKASPDLLGNHDSPGTIDGNLPFHNGISSSIISRCQDRTVVHVITVVFYLLGTVILDINPVVFPSWAAAMG